MNRYIIAIDGPAASGKSTTARLCAKRLGYLHIDTGAMYRAVTLKVIEAGVRVEDRQAVEQVSRETTLRLEPDADGNRVFLDGVEVTAAIRRRNVTRHVSLVSSYPGVREVMVREQRRISQHGGVVLEGRDIGTVVLPEADFKFFLVADDRERARRRMKELERSGTIVSEDELLHDIRARDEKDSTRASSPLRQADDAIVIDTTKLSIEEQVERILQYIQQREQHTV